MYAREYASARGYPYPTVLRWCREGALPSLPIGGKKYWIDPEEADKAIKDMKVAPKHTPRQQEVIKQKQQVQSKSPEKSKLTFLEQLKQIAK